MRDSRGVGSVTKPSVFENQTTCSLARNGGEAMLIGDACVSTQDQNPQLQLDALKAAGCERIFEEKASGAQRDRPELTLALRHARGGDTLVVWKLDRLARLLRQLIETIDGLSERNIGFRSLTESLDADTAGGRLFFQIFGVLAEFEREVIRERVRAGIQASRENGRPYGRPRALNDEDLAIARVMLRNQSNTMADVAKKLNVSVPTLYRHLYREAGV